MPIKRAYFYQNTIKTELFDGIKLELMASNFKKRHTHMVGTWAQKSGNEKLIAEFLNNFDVKLQDVQRKWQVFFTFGKSMFVMKKYVTGAVNFMPMVIKSVKVVFPLLYWEEAYEMLRNENPSHMDSTGEKIRWHRVQLGLSQRQAAALAGIQEKRYKRYESGRIKIIPENELRKLAGVLETDYEALADEYTLFIHRGQRAQLRRYRRSLGMNIKQYADYLGVAAHEYGTWESGKNQISKNSWEKYFGNGEGEAQ